MRTARRNPEEMEAAVRRAARMNMLAGKHFNAGLRGIFFSIGYLGWFVNPVVFMFTTILLFACWCGGSSSRRRADVVVSGVPHSPSAKGESIRPDSQ